MTRSASRRRIVRTSGAAALTATLVVGLIANPHADAAKKKPTSKKTTAAKASASKPVTGGWWDTRTFYEIFVRSFNDSNGDGIGDLNGLRQKLPYLADLGVGAVWLMPIAASNAYHGYTVTDYRTVEPGFGTLDDMRAFIKEAHERDIKVIVDFVVNHTSDQHPWFVEALNPKSPKHDWYVWSKTDPGTSGPWGQKVWHNAGNGQYYFGLFDRSQPDLNLKNPQVTKELVDIGAFWLRDVGVDGFRLDAASHLIENGAQMENTPATLAWWRTFFRAMKTVKPDAFLIGEVNGPARPAATYVPDGLDATFQFDLAKGMLRGVVDKDDVAIAIEQTEADKLYGVGNQYGSFLSNHDQNRVRSVVGGLNRERLAAAQLLTRPGIPFVYYGEEVGLAGVKPDERIRTPMPWTSDRSNAGFTTGSPWEPLDPGNADGFNVEAMAKDPESLLATYRRLMQLRKAEPALQTKGSLIRLKASVVAAQRSGVVPVSAYLRRAGSSTLLVVHHLGTEALTQFGGESPVSLVIDASAASLSAAKSETLFTSGWSDPVSVRVSGAQISIDGPIPPSSTLIARLS